MKENAGFCVHAIALDALGDHLSILPGWLLRWMPWLAAANPKRSKTVAVLSSSRSDIMLLPEDSDDEAECARECGSFMAFLPLDGQMGLLYLISGGDGTQQTFHARLVRYKDTPSVIILDHSGRQSRPIPVTELTEYIRTIASWLLDEQDWLEIELLLAETVRKSYEIEVSTAARIEAYDEYVERHVIIINELCDLGPLGFEKDAFEALENYRESLKKIGESLRLAYAKRQRKDVSRKHLDSLDGEVLELRREAKDKSERMGEIFDILSVFWVIRMNRLECEGDERSLKELARLKTRSLRILPVDHKDRECFADQVGSMPIAQLADYRAHTGSVHTDRLSSKKETCDLVPPEQ